MPDDEKLDETIEETFPASDPPANTVDTGARIGEVPSPDDPDIVDNTAESRLELTVDGQTAFLVYRRTPDRFTIVHTEVPPAIQGRHLGGRLVDAALRRGRSAGLQIVILCPFARAHVQGHRDTKSPAG